MAYAKISPKFWSETRDSTEDARTVELYLLTCSHRNRLGCFMLDPLYAAADLQWEPDRVDQALTELSASQRIRWDSKARVVLLPSVLEDDPLANPNACAGAQREIESVPVTPLFLELAQIVEATHKETVRGWKDRAKYDALLAILAPCANPSLDGSETVASTVPPTVGLSTKPIQASPNQALPNQTLPIQARPNGREVENGLETWKAIKGVVLAKWHLGAEEITVNGGKPVGMGAEMENVLGLVEAYGAEETVGAITVGPELFDFTEPHSLRWYTSREHGAANFHRAEGHWRKGAPRRRTSQVRVE